MLASCADFKSAYICRYAHYEHRNVNVHKFSRLFGLFKSK